MDQRDSSIKNLSVLLSALLLAVVLFLLSKILPTTGVNIQEALAKFCVVPGYINPEPVERWLYIVGTLLSPWLILGSYLLAKRWVGNANNLARTSTVLWILSTLGFVALVLGTLFILESLYVSHSKSLGIFLTSFVAFGIFYYYLHSPQWAKTYWLDAFFFLFILLIFTHHVFHYDIDWIHELHFNAIFYAVVQVFLGKEILVDFLSQYGLFPHILEPIFRVIGLSVTSFTVVMSLLLCASYAFLYKFLRESVQNRLLIFVGLTTLVYFSFVFLAVLFDHFVYLQYFPLRFFFPSLGIYLCWRYFQNYSKKLYYLLSFLGSLAILWNPDTGIILFLSWVGVLLFNEFFQEDRRLSLKNCLKHMAIVFGILILTVGLYSLLMFLRYGKVPDFRLLLEYQKAFIKYHMMLIPMPLWHPWMLVILAYVVGLTHSVHALFQKERNPKTLSICFLSLLGLGIFSYYQGRSHDFALLSVVYPALLLLLLFMDNLCVYLQKGEKRPLALFQLLLFLLTFFSTTAFFYFPSLTTKMLEQVTATLENKTNYIQRNAQFVRENTQPQDTILILSYNDSIYYLAAQKACPIAIPGTSELLFAENCLQIERFIENTESLKIFLDMNFEKIFIDPKKKAIDDLVKTTCRIQAISPDQDLILYVK